LHLQDSLAEANALLHRAGYRFGLVVGDSGELVGWVARDRVDSENSLVNESRSQLPARTPAEGELPKTSHGSGVSFPDTGSRGRDHVGTLIRPFQSSVPLGSSLQKALASMLDHDDGFVAISDGVKIVGVLTPDDLYAAMRHSLSTEP
jgi:CBS domain-containing protein